MDFQWIIFAIVLIANAMAAFVIASMLLRRPSKPGIHSMSFMMFGLSVWSFCYAMITLSPTFETKLFWLKLENIGIQVVPIYWFFFALKYTHLNKWLVSRLAQALFWIIPAVSLVFLASEGNFHLYYASVQVASETGGPLVIARGPMYWIAFVQAYLLMLGGMAALVWRFIKSRLAYRRQTPYLLGAAVIPFVLNVIYQLNPGILPVFTVPIDLTPLSFNITAILLAAGVFGLRMFDLVPIARDTVMEHIPEMVFVIDSHDRVVDANAVAQKWLGKPINEIIGQDPIHVFRNWPQLLNRFFFLEQSREEIRIPGDPIHTLEVVITPIYNRQRQLEGRVIVAYDITERKALENKLKALNESLQRQLNENERLRAQLQEQAIRDPLTGVFNRRFFAEALDKEIARASREHAPFSIIIIDVDHFKQFNDTYGHKCGDFVLQSLAGFLVENTRQSDIVCRYGGEEFVILMPDAALDSAYDRAECFRKKFEETVVEYENRKLKCAFSAGIASYPEHTESADVLLILADEALYHSKSNGRNRVTAYSIKNQVSNPDQSSSGDIHAN
ncbi:MAG: diguanylate cyclase [Anaerolineaceae bacterium]|jgi:diguanylate cyclase (GGDEF)-like protein/PAS domain S-box-containing protein|nr:MAG: diguanylate cyclase [Anaerolineaceae bacterium]